MIVTRNTDYFLFDYMWDYHTYIVHILCSIASQGLEALLPFSLPFVEFPLDEMRQALFGRESGPRMLFIQVVCKHTGKNA